MTREEAIEVLKDIYNYTRFDTYTTNEARTMAIKALEQEPCEDAISRQALLEFFKDDDYVVNEINNMPSVTPKREQGDYDEDYRTLQIKLDNAMDTIENLKEDLRQAREDLKYAEMR